MIDYRKFLAQYGINPLQYLQRGQQQQQFNPFQGQLNLFGQGSDPRYRNWAGMFPQQTAKSWTPPVQQAPTAPLFEPGSWQEQMYTEARANPNNPWSRMFMNKRGLTGK